MLRRPFGRINRRGFGVDGSGGAAPSPPPAAPTLTAPPDNITVFVGEVVPWTATSTDGDLDDIQLVLNPGGSEIVLDTDASSTYGGNWTVAQAIQAGTLVARARRDGLSTDSTAINVTIVNATLVVDTFMASGTWTEPAIYWSPAGVRAQVRAQAWGSGGGGSTAVGSGGGGAFAQTDTVAPGGNVAVTIGAVAVNADGGNSSFGAFVIGAGGKSGTNGSAGGTVADSTGVTKFAGGNGAAGAGNTIGGGGAGDTSAGSTATPGQSTGGFNSVGVAGRYIGAGGSSQAAAQFAGARGEVRVTSKQPGATGYARVRSRSFGRDTANGTSRAATMPSDIVAGDKLIMAVISDGIPVITVAGWNKLDQENEGTSQVSGAWFWKTAVGADTATIATDASEQVAYEIVCCAGAGTPEYVDTSGNSINADPPSATYSGGSAKNLWLVFAGWDQHGVVTAIPASFGSQITVPCQSATAPQLIGCERFVEVDTLNPGAFTSTTEQWVAVTIIVPPA